MEPLLIIGCIFPVIGWVTFITSALQHRMTGKYSSAILIPIVGPVLLNMWSVTEGHDWWLYLLPWILDISTVVFAIAIPNILRDEWQYSRYNNQLTLRSSTGIQSVKLMLQKNNTYICYLKWNRELGVIATNDFGKYERGEGEFISLISHTGKVRLLKKIEGAYICDDIESEGDYNLNGHLFS